MQVPKYKLRHSFQQVLTKAFMQTYCRISITVPCTKSPFSQLFPSHDQVLFKVNYVPGVISRCWSYLDEYSRQNTPLLFVMNSYIGLLYP